MQRTRAMVSQRRGAFRIARIAIVACATLGPMLPADAAAQKVGTSSRLVRAWQQEHGLPVNAVNSIAQTSDGFLWVGTEGGLVRFDGLRFNGFDAHRFPGIANGAITRVTVDARGDVWSATRAGIVRLRAGQPVPLRDSVQLRGGLDVWAAPSGGVWIALADGLIFVGDTGSTFFHMERTGLIRALLPLGPDTVLLGTEAGGVWRLAGGKLARVPGLERLNRTGVRVLARAPDGAIWIGSRSGLARLENGTLREYGLADGVPERWVEAIAFDNRGRLLAGFSDSGVYRLEQGTFTPLTGRQALPDQDVRSILQDRDGTIWLGTTTGGLVSLRRGAVDAVTTADGLGADIVLPVLESRDGAIWMGTFGGGLSVLRDGAVETIGTADGLSSPVVLSLHESRDGSMLVGTRTGVDRVSGSRAVRIPLPLEQVAVSAVLTDRRGRVWAGSSRGLLRRDRGTWTVFDGEHRLRSDFIYSLLEDRRGDVWVGTKGGGLYRFRGDSIAEITTAHGLPSDAVVTLTEDRDGAIWIGTSGGLAHFRNGAVTRIRDSAGLWTGGVNRILRDRAGDYWVTTNRSVTFVPAAEMLAAVRSPSQPVAGVAVSEYDGMPSPETNGAVSPAGWVTGDGRVLLPTMAGLAIVRPDRLRESRSVAPQSIIVSIIVGGGSEPLRAGEPVPAGSQDLSIAYTAPTSVRADDLEFRYRLEGYDRSWVAAGNRRTAYYTNLRPGSYTFSVQARHPGGAWSAEAQRELELDPRFYETRWFRVLSVILLTFLVLGLHRLRVRSFALRQRQLLHLVAERGRAERRYRSLFENAAEIVFTVDTNGRIASLNRKGEQVFGITEREAIGRDFAGLLERGDAAEFRASIADIVAGGPPVEAREIVALSDGRRIPMELSLQAIEEDGGVIGVQAIGRDMTERRRLEEQFRQSQKMEAVGRLAGGVAHDFNNLLTAIRGNAALAQEGLARGEGIEEDLEEIGRSVERAATLTRQLLAFSRRQVLEPKLTDLNGIVTDMERMLRRLIGEEIALRLDLWPEPCPVRVDPGQIEQVILNLVVNSRDAMPGGGEIRVRTRVEASEDETGDSEQLVVLSVEDSGEGMPNEVLPMAFEPFFTTKPQGKGSGLGLATVLGIVQQSGGRITAESTPGVGTTMRIWLPLDASPADAASVAGPTPEAGRGETILIVEDDPAVRSLARRILDRAGYETILAEDGEHAIAVAERMPRIDLLLTDMIMPRMRGSALADRLMASRPGLRVLFMSGYAPEIVGGCTGPLLEKPFTPAALTAKVREVLDSGVPVG